MTFPSPGQWDVPARGWHIDFPARGALLLKWLGYLASVTAQGGGTVVLAGSHRLVERYLLMITGGLAANLSADHQLVEAVDNIDPR